MSFSEFAVLQYRGTPYQIVLYMWIQVVRMTHDNVLVFFRLKVYSLYNIPGLLHKDQANEVLSTYSLLTLLLFTSAIEKTKFII